MTLFRILVVLAAGFVYLSDGKRYANDGQKPMADAIVGRPELGHISLATDQLERFIQQKMKKWHVPGLAIGIIDGNSTWFKGFGYADLESSTPVTDRTLFYCGSTTKSFTAAAISLLVDSPEYPIQWDTSVSQLLREDFVLSDPWATEHITITDALSHRTGYPRHDMALNMPSAAALARNLRNLPMTAEPRTRFLYNNMMFGIMGHLISVLSGKPLVSFLRDKFWKPWGMNSTFLGIDDLKDQGRYDELAQEYMYANDSDTFVPLPHYGFMADAGAGAVISNVRDYAKYLRAMMDKTAPVSQAAHAMLRQPHNPVSPGEAPWTGPVWYGLAWENSIFQNQLVHYHGGAVNAFIVNMLMIPGKNFGLLTMLNSNSNAQEIIVWEVLYEYFNVPKEERFDIEERAAQRDAMQQNFLATCKKVLYPKAASPPLDFQLPLSNFSGTYFNTGYGTVKLAMDCHPTQLPPDSAARPTVDTNGCILTIGPSSPVMRAGLTFRAVFEHVSGNYWVAWAYIEQMSEAGHNRPITCLRAQFEVDERGVSHQFALDLRMEEIDGPLVWFSRVEGEEESELASVNLAELMRTPQWLHRG